MLTETVSCRFGETYSRLPLAGSVDLRLRTLKLPYSKYSLGANVVWIVAARLRRNPPADAAPP